MKTPRIRSRIELLISTYNTLVLHSNLAENLALSVGFNTIYWYIR